MRQTGGGGSLPSVAVWLVGGALLMLAGVSPIGGLLGTYVPPGPAPTRVDPPTPVPPVAAVVLPEPSPTLLPPPTPTPRSVPTPPSAASGESQLAPVAPPAGRGPEASPSPSPSPSPSAVAACSIGESFGRLAEALGDERIGRCLEGEYINMMTGNVHQRTTRGLLVWLKESGTAAFTDGSNTWYGCASAVERRPADLANPC